MKISILIPVLNERKILGPALENLRTLLSSSREETKWDVVISDGGSTDGSLEVLRPLAERYRWTLIKQRLAEPSVGRTLSPALSACRGRYVLILPIDVSLTKDALIQLRTTLSQSGVQCGGFPKKYDSSHWLLALYQWGQNLIRLQLLKQLVWTNGIFFELGPTLRVQIPTLGFMEDVLLSDELRKAPGWRRVATPVIVSARRYYPNRILRRICINGLIMMLFRLKLKSVEDLKQIYYGKNPVLKGGVPLNSAAPQRLDDSSQQVPVNPD